MARTLLCVPGAYRAFRKIGNPAADEAFEQTRSLCEVRQPH